MNNDKISKQSSEHNEKVINDLVSSPSYFEEGKDTLENNNEDENSKEDVLDFVEKLLAELADEFEIGWITQLKLWIRDTFYDPCTFDPEDEIETGVLFFR